MIKSNKSGDRKPGGRKGSLKSKGKDTGKPFRKKGDHRADKERTPERSPKKSIGLKSHKSDSFKTTQPKPESDDRKAGSDKPVKRNRVYGKRNASGTEKDRTPEYGAKRDIRLKSDKNESFKTASHKPGFDDRRPGSDKPAKRTRVYKKNDESEMSYQDKKARFSRKSNDDIPVKTGRVKSDLKERFDKPYSLKNSVIKKTERTSDITGLMRLNQYLAHAGICSRREADNLIASGVVMINGRIVTELGTKVNPGDTVQYGGDTISGERKVYLLLNKPKGYISTFDDPEDRNTVMDLVKNACKERIYPVGRLDRNTTGLLLFTNDGEMTKKLTHPKYGVRKVYYIQLDKPLTRADMRKIEEGVDLEDGLVTVDSIAYVKEDVDKCEIGMEIHSGKNRVIRRIFESLDYKVIKLDRVIFAGLTKKDLPRGRWRFLSEQEINFLKMIG